MTQEELRNLNPHIKDPNKISVGQKINIGSTQDNFEKKKEYNFANSAGGYNGPGGSDSGNNYKSQGGGYYGNNRYDNHNFGWWGFGFQNSYERAEAFQSINDGMYMGRNTFGGSYRMDGSFNRGGFSEWMNRKSPFYNKNYVYDLFADLMWHRNDPSSKNNEDSKFTHYEVIKEAIRNLGNASSIYTLYDNVSLYQRLCKLQ